MICNVCYHCRHIKPGVISQLVGSVRGNQGGRTGAGAPPVAALGIIGQVASHLLINIDKINIR